ncbi:MAG: glycosyltransferase family 1 protein [Candidatus Auribacter fodinae]|uniref:Glycosyltransferase family 1 protein n=1 Tax=Candidatus Auribacter fodinae TaxID=2093366 RepID=A0A3A4QWG2_9BACT|nr:MAG: glycosyltransferase family 1 protein [Candidatus Auribacter fodinae]
MKRTSAIIYPINIRFPMERANSIQVVNTCRALAEAGVLVYLLVRHTSELTEQDMLAFYGLKPHPNLMIKKIPVIKSENAFIANKSYYLSVLKYIFYLRMAKRIRVLFLRDLGLAHYLSKVKWLFGFRFIYEAHLISYLFAEHQHELLPDSKPATDKYKRSLYKKEKCVFRTSDSLIAITHHLKDNLVQQFKVNPERVSVIPDAADISLYKGVREKRNEIIYIGQLYPWKGVATLVRAMKYITWPLKVIGGLPWESDLQSLKELAQELGVADKIEFTGFLRYRDTARHLAKARISVIPLSDNIIAREYTSPLKLFESMAARTAVVASDLPSIREIIQPEFNGMLFEAGNPRALAQAVNTLIDRHDLMVKIVENSFNTVQAYSWEKRASHIKEIIDAL